MYKPIVRRSSLTTLTTLAALVLLSLLLPTSSAQAGFAGDIATVLFGPVGMTRVDGARLSVSWVAPVDPKGGLPIGLALIGPDGAILAQRTFSLLPGNTVALQFPDDLGIAGAAPTPFDTQPNAPQSIQVTGLLLVDTAEPVPGLAASLQLFDLDTGRTTLSVHPGHVNLVVIAQPAPQGGN